MFGVFFKETATDYQILVNVDPFRTDLRFLSKAKYSKVSEIPVGVKVQFDESKIMLAEYFNCSYCHLPKLDSHLDCFHPAKNTVSATGKITESKFTWYDSRLGLEVTVKHEEKTYYFIVFREDAWFDVVKKMSVGDELTFKAVLSKYEDDNSNNNFVKLFYIKL